MRWCLQARTSPRLPEAAIITGSRPPGDRAARPGAVHDGTGIETARASKELEGAGARRAVPGPVTEWGRRSPEGWSGHRVRGRRTARTRRGVGRGMQHRGSPSTMEAPPAASGCFLGLRARAGRRGRRRWSVCEVAARGELSCRQTATSRGDPHTEGFAGPWEWIVGVAGSTPVYRGSPLFWGRSWGRVVPCGAQAAVRRTRARMGVDPVTVVLHYVYTKHPGGVGPTSFDCPRDHEFSVPDGAHRAGRTRSEAWMGGGGGGHCAGVGGGVFRDLGVRSGGWAGRGSLSSVPSLRGGSCRCIRGDR